MTAQPPPEPPASGPAVEQPPHRLDDRPKVTVYRHPRPALWIFWPDRWVHAEVRARHDYADGRNVYQVELPLPDSAQGSRDFQWGKDNVRPAKDDK